MSKKIAVINDLSGLGRCSLIAAISTISAMGVQPCPLPTAILTAQTEYPTYFCDDYTDKMEIFRKEWKKLGRRFDGIYTGFVASEAQIEHIFEFIHTFKEEDTFLLVDPVMGDDGMQYDMFTPRLLEEMRKLSKYADVITPNLTELCLLTEASYSEVSKVGEYEKLLEEITALARAFMEAGPKHVIVTGIRFTDDKERPMMGNLYVTQEETKMYAFPYIGGSYSGTGDLFASCVAAGIARGDEIKGTIHLAGEFLKLALTDSVQEQIPQQDGVNYEKYLWKLMKR